MAPLVQDTDLRSRLLARMAASLDEAWPPGDFAALGSRAAVGKTLQRLVAAGGPRLVHRGLYDQPRKNLLTDQPYPTIALSPVATKRGPSSTA